MGIAQGCQSDFSDFGGALRLAPAAFVMDGKLFAGVEFLNGVIRASSKFLP